MTEIGIAQGLPATRFEVLDHRRQPAGTFTSASLANRGDLAYLSDTGVVSRGKTGVGANVRYMGFYDTYVVDDMDTRRIDVHGEYAAQNTGKVSVWQEGEFRIANVSGAVADGALVYPAADGALSASQTGADAAVGRCIRGNDGVSGGPITIRIDFYTN